jgi:hypothetical protein
VSAAERCRIAGARLALLALLVSAAAATAGLLVAATGAEATASSRSLAPAACALLPVSLAEKALSSKVTAAAEFQGTKSAANCTFANPRGGGASSIAILVQAGTAHWFHD